MNLNNILFVCGIIVLLILGPIINDAFITMDSFSNAETAYDYHIEKTNCTGYNCGPSCSLQARIWIDEYREDHNLTDDEFCCAVWFNDQSDWFYY